MIDDVDLVCLRDRTVVEYEFQSVHQHELASVLNRLRDRTT